MKSYCFSAVRPIINSPFFQPIYHTGLTDFLFFACMTSFMEQIQGKGTHTREKRCSGGQERERERKKRMSAEVILKCKSVFTVRDNKIL